MKTQKEIQTASHIWILINRLNDLLFERYEEDFPDIDLPEEEESPGTIVPPSLTRAQDKAKR